MRSRMDRYIESNEVLERTSKNDALYEELYKEKQTPRSNVTVLDNINEIDISKIKDIVNSREEYRKTRKYENLVSPIDIDSYKKKNIEYQFDEIDNNDYDINQILLKKRSDRVYNKEEPKIRKISETQYDILKSLDIHEDDVKPDYMTQENNLKDLLNTIAKSKTVNESTDLFANLKEESKEEEIDKSFYTNADTFSDLDFDIEESKSSGSKILIIIVLSALIIAIGIFIWFKFFK